MPKRESQTDDCSAEDRQRQPALSFADPRTHYHLERGAEGECGGHIGEPTGTVECCQCGAKHSNIDEIPHDEDCANRFVHSRFYVDRSQR